MLNINLIFGSQLDENGITTNLLLSHCTFFHLASNSELLGKIEKRLLHGVYITLVTLLKGRGYRMVNAAKRVESHGSNAASVETWHKRLSYASYDSEKESSHSNK